MNRPTLFRWLPHFLLEESEAFIVFGSLAHIETAEA